MLHPVLKNTLAVAAGALLGMLVNMALITIGPYIIPPPAGADMQTAEGLAAAMPLLQPQHFVMPWLAARLAVYKKLLWAMLIGSFFLWGGIAMVRMLPTPAWFIAADLLGAYLPMSYLGWRLAD